MRYLDPKNDITFKKIFGEHKHLCISLLNALLPLDDDQLIEEIEYRTPEMYPLADGQKNTIVDVRCKDNTGRTFIVEMQLYWSRGFMPRMLLNSAKAYASQTLQGQRFINLQPVYSLCILDDVYLHDKKYADTFSHVYSIRHDEYPELKMEGMTFVFIELPKFHSNNKAIKKMANLWLRFFTEVKDSITRDKIDSELTENKDIANALDILEEASYNDAERYAYEQIWDAVSIQRTILDDAETSYSDGITAGRKKGLEEGRKEGLEEGRKEGLEEGRKEGLEEGRKEGLEEGRKESLKQVASNMKQMGIPIEQIAQATGLTTADIELL